MAVINGCSAVELRDRPTSGVKLVDPTELALRLLGTVDEAGILPSTEASSMQDGPR